MAPNDVSIILTSFNEQFGLLQTQLSDTKDDLTKNIDEVKVDVRTCVDRITAIEKSEIELKIESQTQKEKQKEKGRLWETFIKTVTICTVPVLLTLLYSIFAIASKLGISPF